MVRKKHQPPTRITIFLKLHFKENTVQSTQRLTDSSMVIKVTFYEIMTASVCPMTIPILILKMLHSAKYEIVRYGYKHADELKFS